MRKVKVTHISDTHYCSKNLVETDKCMLDFIKYNQEVKPDSIALTGDSTEHRLDAHSISFRTLSMRIKELSNIAPLVLLQGTFSHEPVGTIELLQMVSGIYPIAIANRLCQIALTKENTWIYSEGELFLENELDLQNIVLVYTCAPTLNKSDVASSNTSGDDVGYLIGFEIAKFLLKAGEINTYFRKNEIPTLGLSHGTVHGCKTEHGVPMNGFDHEFSADDLFSSNCSAFLLGHIHLHQTWENEGRYIGYPGSNGRFHLGEIGDKGFIDWDVDASGSFPNFIKTNAREIKYYDFDGMPDIEYLKKESEFCEGFFIRVRWQIDLEHRQVVTRQQIEELFSSSLGVHVEIRNLVIQRSRAQGINQEITLSQKIKKWCDVTDIDSEPLLERVCVLESDSSINIASLILASVDLDD